MLFQMKKREKTDESIKVKHGLTFQALRRIYSLSNVVIVAFLSSF